MMKKLKLWSMMMLAAMTMSVATSCGGDDGGDAGNKPVNPDNPDNPDPNAIISFKDNKVAMICIANFDLNKDNQLSYGEVATVRSLSGVFAGEPITLFDEFKYFTGLSEISSRAFSGCSSLTSITIPNSVTSIGEQAFSGCSSLASITIPNNVSSIGNNAFSGCSSLLSVIIGNSVTSIGIEAFYGCSGLTTVTIGNSVKSIGRDAFYACYKLEKVIVSNIAAWCGIKFYNYDHNPLYYAHYIYSDENTEIKNLVIPNSVTSIGDWAFWQCSGIASVTISNSVTSIGEHAFEYCPGLTSIVVESGNCKYDSRNNCNALIETASNRLITGCNNTIIPNGVTSIGEHAFYGCTRLSSITIPNSVTSIGEHAFYNCTRLTSIVSQIVNPFSVYDSFSTTLYQNATLYVPKGTIDKYKATDGWSKFKKIVEQ